MPEMHPTVINAHAKLLTKTAWRNLGKFLYTKTPILYTRVLSTSLFGLWLQRVTRVPAQTR